MPLPTFLVIGAPKSGTTSLHSYLGEHPQVAVSKVKETKFFAYAHREINYTGPGDDHRLRNRVKSLECYEAQFETGRDTLACGEVDPIYMYEPGVAERIASLVPAVKLIAILRHPVDRAFSNYRQQRSRGEEECETFEEALSREQSRIDAGWSPIWHYAAKGFYGEQLARYVRLFERSQILVRLYDDLCGDPVQLIRDVYAFIGVDASYLPDLDKKHHVTPKIGESGGVLRRFMANLGGATNRLAADNDRSVADDVYNRVLSRFDADLDLLGKIIDRDLSGWRSPRRA